MSSVGRILFGVGLLILALGPATAAPPASCAHKFIGTWTVRVNASGQTYPLLIRPNGTSHITCPLCPPEGTWFCEGNVLRSLEPVSTTSTLSADGRTLIGGCCTTTRVGAPPVVAAAVAPASHQPTGQPPASRPRTVSCDTVRKPAPAYKDCDDADFALHAARGPRRLSARLGRSVQKGCSRRAARRVAGDAKLELTILREATAAPQSESGK